VNPPDDSPYCITGKFNGWTGGNNKTLHANIYSASHHIYSIAKCPIDAQGNFNLCLPSVIADTTLMFADSIFYSGCTSGNVLFNPSDTKGVEVYNFRIKSGDTIVGSARYNNHDTLITGSIDVMYVFANKNVSVTGYKVCTSDTLRFNGTAISGWTRVVKKCIRRGYPSDTFLYDTSEPTGAVWKFSLISR
jgi:hypothetical protein